MQALSESQAWIELLGVALVALLYSSVGHAGASGYIAWFTFLGRTPSEFRPLVLLLNLGVATLAGVQFTRAGHLAPAVARSKLLPLLLASVPAAFVGARVNLAAGWIAPWIKPLLGAMLAFSSVRFFWSPREMARLRSPPTTTLLAVGGGIGLLAGLTGTGGGIFLTPLLLILGWAGTREAAAISAVFIWVNSAAGLLALHSHPWQNGSEWLLAAALLSGAVGSDLGSRRLPVVAIRRILAVTLAVAAIKLLFGA
jgi:uncharacterized membrane protein YfcA